MDIIYVLVIGAICGWLAGNVMKGGGFGIIVNIILGIVGSFVGSYLFGILKISIPFSPLISSIITGFAGSVVVLFIAGLIKK